MLSKNSFLTNNQIEELSRLIDKSEVEKTKSVKILKLSVKARQEIYNQIRFSRREIKISDDEFDDLISKNILKIVSKKESKITLTLKAIMIIKYKMFDPDNKVIAMLDDINKEFFDDVMHLSEKSINSKQKAIIIALIGLNAFSENYTLQLKVEKENQFKEAVDLAVNFIKNLGQEFDDGSLDKLWSRKVIGEGPVLSEMRRLDQIPRSTEGIYKATRLGHYLDILNNNKVDDDKFNYILSKIFDKRMPTYEEKKKMIKVLDDIQQYEYKIFKTTPPFNTLDIKKRIRFLIESWILK